MKRKKNWVDNEKIKKKGGVRKEVRKEGRNERKEGREGYWR
jgi:hypothetical protein